MDSRRVDVLIVGASFAGLAVANQLRGYRVLLVDRKPVGSGQTSACGTILPVLDYWELTDTVVQTHNSLVLHTARDAHEFPSPYLWCTFDYQGLCEVLVERSGADFLQASVLDYDGVTVHTSRGRIRPGIVVDASGWKAVLASAVQPGYPSRAAMNFGIETVRTLVKDGAPEEDSLHFYYDPDILPHGVGWIFPRGERASIGLGHYRGALSLRRPLQEFMAEFGVEPDGIHGTYFPIELRAPTAGEVFVVGDAAGMCLGLTGEGIRPALFFGEACGRIIRKVLGGELTPDAGRKKYVEFVRSKRRLFQVFTFLQAFLTRVPTSWIDGVAALVKHKRVRTWVLDRYWALTSDWEPS